MLPIDNRLNSDSSNSPQSPPIPAAASTVDQVAKRALEEKEPQMTTKKKRSVKQSKDEKVEQSGKRALGKVEEPPAKKSHTDLKKLQLILNDQDQLRTHFDQHAKGDIYGLIAPFLELTKCSQDQIEKLRLLVRWCKKEVNETSFLKLLLTLLRSFGVEEECDEMAASLNMTLIAFPEERIVKLIPLINQLHGCMSISTFKMTLPLQPLVACLEALVAKEKGISASLFYDLVAIYVPDDALICFSEKLRDLLAPQRILHDCRFFLRAYHGQLFADKRGAEGVCAVLFEGPRLIRVHLKDRSRSNKNFSGIIPCINALKRLPLHLRRPLFRELHEKMVAYALEEQTRSLAFEWFQGCLITGILSKEEIETFPTLAPHFKAFIEFLVTPSTRLVPLNEEKLLECLTPPLFQIDQCTSFFKKFSFDCMRFLIQQAKDETTVFCIMLTFIRKLRDDVCHERFVEQPEFIKEVSSGLNKVHRYPERYTLYGFLAQFPHFTTFWDLRSSVCPPTRKDFLEYLSRHFGTPYWKVIRRSQAEQLERIQKLLEFDNRKFFGNQVLQRLIFLHLDALDCNDSTIRAKFHQIIHDYFQRKGQYRPYHLMAGIKALGRLALTSPALMQGLKLQPREFDWDPSKPRMPFTNAEKIDLIEAFGNLSRIGVLAGVGNDLWKHNSYCFEATFTTLAATIRGLVGQQALLEANILPKPTVTYPSITKMLLHREQGQTKVAMKFKVTRIQETKTGT